MFIRYADYLATFPDEENEGENFGKYAMRNTLAGVYKMAAHGKTVRLYRCYSQFSSGLLVLFLDV